MFNSDASKEKPTTHLIADHLPPALLADDEMMRKVDHSTISLASLLKGEVRPDQIERALSCEGCGAVLIKLDQYYSAVYERFYRLQWQLGHRVFENDTGNKETAAPDFAALDTPVRELLCRCGVAVARTRKGIMSPMVWRPSMEVKRLLGTNAATLSVAIGRPLAANRKEFHPSVDWLLEQEEKGCLQKDENPSYRVVAQSSDAGRRIVGRSQADETRLLALYREWKLANPREQQGHGNKHNGDVYYGAFRGRTHVDCGSTMSVLFGAGDVRDGDGFPVDGATRSQELGGTLMVASPGEKKFTSLPYRLPCGTPYVVVFFEEFYQRARTTPPASIGEEAENRGSQEVTAARRHRRQAINTNALGWAATVHGVRRIENTGFSRGQTIVHVHMTEEDIV